MRLLFISLRNLLGAGGVVLLLLCGVRLYPVSAAHACQEVRIKTRDNVPMTVDAVVYFRVIDPVVCGRASGEVRESDFAHFTDSVA